MYIFGSCYIAIKFPSRLCEAKNSKDYGAVLSQKYIVEAKTDGKAAIG